MPDDKSSENQPTMDWEKSNPPTLDWEQQDNLPTVDWKRVDEHVRGFARAYEQGSDATGFLDISRYLPPKEDALRRPVLLKLIQRDLEMRWRLGSKANLEEYLAKYLELGGKEHVPATLVFEEFRVRQQFGDHPTLDHYRTRFPKQFEMLQRLIKEQPVSTDFLFSGTPPSNPVLVTPTATSPMELSVGGGYQLLKRLGKGTFGEVWQALAPGGVEVAVKVVSRCVGKEEAEQESSALELIKNIRHPHLMQTHAFYALEERLYIVMELADCTLLDRAKECSRDGQKGIPLPELIRYFRETAEGLDFLHSKNVHHRDIKPANILILQGHAKVADYGLAKLLDRQHSMMEADTVGTAAYMAPEVWEGRLSAHSDQYSLAMTYAELRMNERLFKSKAIMELMKFHLESTPDLSILPEEERPVLLRALSKKPSDRYPTCAAFVDALHEVLFPPPPPEVLPAPPVSKWIRAAQILVPLVLIMVAVVIAINLSRTPTLNFVQSESLLIVPGKTKSFALPIEHQYLKEPVKLTFAGLPPHVRIEEQEMGLDQKEAAIVVVADPDAEPGKTAITITAESGSTTQSVTLPLNVIFLPAQFEALDDQLVPDVLGQWYLPRIARIMPDQSRIELILIPQTAETQKLAGERDVRTFYMMKDKVTYGQFSAFDGQPGNRVQHPEWREPPWGINDQFPVTKVSVQDANRFAHWLGIKSTNDKKKSIGRLPSVNQWQKAAGLYWQPAGEGPFRGEWTKNKNLDLALNRKSPLPIGEAKDDISSYGIRDMAANGIEWTRTISLNDAGLEVPLPNEKVNDPVEVRGVSFRFPDPFLFSDIKNGLLGTLDYDKVRDDVGFRVVIEPEFMITPSAGKE